MLDSELIGGKRHGPTPAPTASRGSADQAIRLIPCEDNHGKWWLPFWLPVSIEHKHRPQIPDGWAVEREVRVGSGLRVGKVIPAPFREGLQAPIPLDEFQDGSMIGIGMVYMASLFGGKRGNRNHDGSRAIAKEIDRLDVAGIVVTAAFIEGHQNNGVLPQGVVFLDGFHHFSDEFLE